MKKSAPAGGGFAGSEEVGRVCVRAGDLWVSEPKLRKDRLTAWLPFPCPSQGGGNGAQVPDTQSTAHRQYAALDERRSTDSFGRPPLDNVGSARTMDGVSSDMEVSALGQVPDRLCRQMRSFMRILRNAKNLGADRGFVKKSATFSSVGTNGTLIS